MKTVLTVLLAIGLACRGADLRAEGARPAERAVAPKNDLDKALEAFLAFQVAVSLKDWPSAARWCVERVGDRWVMPAATESLGDLLPVELRDPAKKVAIYSAVGNSWSMSLGIAVVGEKASEEGRSVRFQSDGRGRPWFLVIGK